VFGRAVAIGGVEIALLRVGVELGFEGEPLGRRPVKRIGGKVVREINPLAARERGVGCGHTGDPSQGHEATQAVLKEAGFHNAILTDRAVEDKAGGLSQRGQRRQLRREI